MRLELDQLQHSYDAVSVINGIDLQLESSHALALVGPSGGGKSTLLRLLAGLEVPDAGRISLNGTPFPQDPASLRRLRQRFGIVFQGYNLFPHLDARTNITLPLQVVHGQSSEKALAAADELLDRFDLNAHATKTPLQLSGGQQQRVALIRALAPQPEILFLDEPTSALDPEMTAEVLAMVESIRQLGTELVLVTHEVQFARKAADHIAFLAEGRIIASGTAQNFFEEASDPTVQRFWDKVTRFHRD